MRLNKEYFKKDVITLAKNLLGKVICRKIDKYILKVRIIETEAYSISEPASHSSLGYSKKMLQCLWTLALYICITAEQEHLLILVH